ncbi:MAG: hypothetical protein ABL956_00255 [Hyphomonadaceae bacterium]
MTTKLSISLTDAHVKLIDKTVEFGQFGSSSEDVRIVHGHRHMRADDV